MWVYCSVSDIIIEVCVWVYGSLLSCQLVKPENPHKDLGILASYVPTTDFSSSLSIFLIEQKSKAEGHTASEVALPSVFGFLQNSLKVLHSEIYIFLVIINGS